MLKEFVTALLISRGLMIKTTPINPNILVFDYAVNKTVTSSLDSVDANSNSILFELSKPIPWRGGNILNEVANGISSIWGLEAVKIVKVDRETVWLIVLWVLL